MSGVSTDRRAVLAGATALAGAAVATRAMGLSLPFVGGGGGDGPKGYTQYGWVQGELKDGVSVFKGIPYGATTGGDARFTAPQPLKPWGVVRPATSFGDQCPQSAAKTPPYWSSWQINTGESEDCLALNVWTPAAGDGKKRPVMVWLHGGGFDQFNGSAPVYDGTRLCQRGDVVVVTLNHRLNLFGYLYLAELGGGEFVDSGNVGQLDIIAALTWVKNNIEAFGGDPGKVMIFGESGGGAKVSTLLAMPGAKGLFHRAAIQSGPGLTAIPKDRATATAQALCRAAGVSENKPQDLQHMDPQRLVDAMERAGKEHPMEFGPVIDGRNLYRDPFTPGAPTDSTDVPVIVGYNATETSVFSPPPIFNLDWPGLKPALAPQLPGADVDALIAGYRKARPDATAPDIYFAITTDRSFGWGSIALAERKAALGPAAAYLYRVEFQTPVGHLRSPHSIDIPLVFDNVGKSASLLGASAPDAQKAADQMSGAFLAFARTGSPNGTGLPSWPRYDARSRSTMVFDVISRAVNDPHSDERQLISALPPPKFM